MAIPTITLEGLRKLKPCTDGLVFAESNLPKHGKITAQMAADAGFAIDALVWVASALARSDKQIERLIRHWLADCASRVLSIYERTYSTDMRIRNAIIAAHALADGVISDADLASAKAGAWDAAWADGGVISMKATWNGAMDAVKAVTWDPAWDAAGHVALDDDEYVWQFKRFLLWLSGDEPTPIELPEVQS